MFDPICFSCPATSPVFDPICLSCPATTPAFDPICLSCPATSPACKSLTLFASDAAKNGAPCSTWDTKGAISGIMLSDQTFASSTIALRVTNPISMLPHGNRVRMDMVNSAVLPYSQSHEAFRFARWRTVSGTSERSVSSVFPGNPYASEKLSATSSMTFMAFSSGRSSFKLTTRDRTDATPFPASFPGSTCR